MNARYALPDPKGNSAAGRTEFYTNRTLVHLMTLMLDPQPGESIITAIEIIEVEDTHG